jgi:hypothetical protein
MLTVVPDGRPGREGGNGGSPSLIDEIAREGAADGGRGAARRGGRVLIALAWFRKTASVLAALPGSAHSGAKKVLAGILIERPEPAAA